MLPFGIINDGNNRQEGKGDGEGNVWFEDHSYDPLKRHLS